MPPQIYEWGWLVFHASKLRDSSSLVSTSLRINFGIVYMTALLGWNHLACEQLTMRTALPSVSVPSKGRLLLPFLILLLPPPPLPLFNGKSKQFWSFNTLVSHEAFICLNGTRLDHACPPAVTPSKALRMPQSSPELLKFCHDSCFHRVCSQPSSYGWQNNRC